MVTVKSATYGDEKTTTDVTTTISGKITNGKANFTVDDSIVPMLRVNQTVTLDDDEKEAIQAQAQKECKSANDKPCINATVNRISQAKMEEKIENERRIGNVKGSRLTVTLVDDKGRESTVMVPKGQSFTYGQAAVAKPSEKTSLSGSGLLMGGAKTLGKIGLIVLSFVLVVLWAYSIGATWRAFMQEYYTRAGYIATAVAILVPLSGFIITPVFYAFLKYFA